MSIIKRAGDLSPDDKRRVLRELMGSRHGGRGDSPANVERCAVCTLPVSTADDGVRRCSMGHVAGAVVAAANGASDSPPRHHAREQTPSPARTPYKATVHTPSPATYRALNRMEEHTMRCYITPEHVLKAVRKHLHRNNAALQDADILHLKCSGIGEQFVRLENLGGLVNLHTLVAANHAFTKIDGLKPLVNLTHLDLSCNKLTRVENISHLTRLEELNLGGNLIEHIPSDSVWPKSLRVLRMAQNRLSTLEDLHNLRPLLSLTVMDLRENPICSQTLYRSIAAYAALSLQELDEVAVSETERDAAIFHWDRKGLRPLQTELSAAQKKVEELQRQLEATQVDNHHKDGQLEAVSKLLEISHTESDAVREQKAGVEEELLSQQQEVSTLQSSLLRTRSDLEFLKLELEMIHPDVSKSIISKCSDTLGRPGGPNTLPSPRSRAPPAVVSPPAATPRARTHSNPAPTVVRRPRSPPPPPPPPPPERPQQAFSPPPNYPTATAAAATAAAAASTADAWRAGASAPSSPDSLVMRYGTGVPSSGGGGRAGGGSAPATPSSRPDTRRGAPSSTHSRPRAGRTGWQDEAPSRLLATPPSRVLRAEDLSLSLPESRASTVVSGVPRDADLQAKFARLIDKALHCEKCSVAYAAKRRTALAKCSPDHLLGTLQERYPDFRTELDEEIILDMVTGWAREYQDRALLFAEKADECVDACHRYVRRAQEVLAQLS